MNGQYEVMSPWADVNPVPLSGISPRLSDLSGKKIGLFSNGKAAADPMLAVVESRLKQRYDDVSFSMFHRRVFLEVAQTEDKERYENWVKEMDAIIYAVGD
jgi:hypothetical protein